MAICSDTEKQWHYIKSRLAPFTIALIYSAIWVEILAEKGHNTFGHSISNQSLWHRTQRSVLPT